MLHDEGKEFRYFLTWYNTSALLPLRSPGNNLTNYSYVVDSEVLGLAIPTTEVINTSQPIVLQFASMRAMSDKVRIYCGCYHMILILLIMLLF